MSGTHAVEQVATTRSAAFRAPSTARRAQRQIGPTDDPAEHEAQRVTERRGLTLQRQPRAAGGADRRNYVQTTIDFLDSSAQFYADQHVRVDSSLLDRVINSWQVMVTEGEATIDASLAGDLALKAALHAAYRAAIQALITRAAHALGRSEADLLRENSGRIPMWAWPTPHHLVPGISTPIEEGETVGAGGAVRFTRNGFAVTVAPDSIDRSLGDRAETRIAMNWRLPRMTTRGGRVTAFSPPARPTVRIQSFFARRGRATSPSGYGRGTTAEDVAGGRLAPRSTTLGFHEGSHGLAFVEFLETHPVPRFTGAVGMTAAQFRAAGAQWDRDLRDYSRQINRFSEQAVDCVGTTIDQFEQARAGAGVHIRLVCGP